MRARSAMAPLLALICPLVVGCASTRATTAGEMLSSADSKLALGVV